MRPNRMDHTEEEPFNDAGIVRTMPRKTLQDLAAVTLHQTIPNLLNVSNSTAT